jgi:hypothetical protein
VLWIQDQAFFCEWVLFETADGLVNRTGRGGENYGESSANDSLLHPTGRRLRRTACRKGEDQVWVYVCIQDIDAEKIAFTHQYGFLKMYDKISCLHFDHHLRIQSRRT